MGIETDVLKVLPALQATALLNSNLKMLNFGKNKKTSLAKPNFKALTSKKILKIGATNIVGTTMISATARSINGL